MKRVLLAGLIGGLALFFWDAVSWMVLPWHEPTFQKFTQENVVEVVLTTNAPKAGIYLLPNPFSKSPEEKKLAHEKMATGPFGFVVMSPHGTRPMNANLGLSLVIQIAAALLVSLLLSLRAGTSTTSYLAKVGFVVLFAVAAGLVSRLADWTWWNFPAHYTLVAMADLTIGWFLAGLAIAKITG